jgi:NADH-quinone oxidoreductase subunit E
MKTASLHHEYQPSHFKFNVVNEDKIKAIFALYPIGKQKSAIMPLLDLAQRQVAVEGPYGPYKIGGGWIPRVAMDEIARLVDVAPIKVYEVATFYSMYNLHPVGKYLLQVCTTSPCMLGGVGSEIIVETIKNHLSIDFEETTTDGLFTLKDVECLGACVNAPVVQINDDYYEDLTPEKITSILNELKQGRVPPKGSQSGRKGSCALTGSTSLKELVK